MYWVKNWININVAGIYCSLFQSRRISENELLSLHSKEHIEMMQKLKEMKPKDIDKLQDKFHSLYLHPESYESARLAAGCVLQVCLTLWNY